ISATLSGSSSRHDQYEDRCDKGYDSPAVHNIPSQISSYRSRLVSATRRFPSSARRNPTRNSTILKRQLEERMPARYRAEQVGSLLRPAELLQARAAYAQSKIQSQEVEGRE